MNKKSQAQLDELNLRFYSEMFKQHEWGTDVIHWSVFHATLKEIADRYAALFAEVVELRRDRARLDHIEAIARKCPRAYLAGSGYSTGVLRLRVTIEWLESRSLRDDLDAAIQKEQEGAKG